MADRNIVNLFQVRPQVSPADLLANMSAYCEELGVSTMDVYGDGGIGVTAESSWLRRFECEVADSLGMGKGLFLPSGTMGQQIALCIHGQKQEQSPSALAVHGEKKRDLYFICHHSSHLLLHEFNSYDALLGMRAVVILPEEGSPVQGPLTFESFMSAVASVPTTEGAALCCAIIECPHRELGGKCTPLADIVRISEYCRSNNIKLHLDGARLWEAQAWYCSGTGAIPLQEFCRLFDSIYVSFYKGLGGVTGAMLLSHPRLEGAPSEISSSFLQQARQWTKRFGGGLFSCMPFAVSCWHQFRAFHSVDTFVRRRDRLREVVASISAALGEYMQQTEGDMAPPPLLFFDPPVPQVSLIHVYFGATPEITEQAHQAAMSSTGVAVYARVRPAGALGCYTEFNMGDLNGSIPTERWVAAYSALISEIIRMTKMLLTVRRAVAGDTQMAAANTKSSSPVR